MKRFLVVVAALVFAVPCQAAGIRASTERIMTNGNPDLSAFQLEGEFVSIGPVDLGASVRKESFHPMYGWGFGLHASHQWSPQGRWSFIGQVGVRWFIVSPEYSQFHFFQKEGILQYQRWVSITPNAVLPFVDGDRDTRLRGAALVPTLGVHAQWRMVGKLKLRVGMRAVIARYSVQEAFRGADGDLHTVHDGGAWRIVPAPTVSIGF